MIVLSDRLKVIADKIKQDYRLADIGSDHALLPAYLAEQGIISFAVAGEINPGPYEAAKRQVETAGLQKIIDVRSGNGLSVIQDDDIDVITIAGMGGSLITQILSEGHSKLNNVKQLILQPNVGEEWVRRWLFQHDWFLIEEDIVLEDDKIYEILNVIKVEDASKLNQDLYSEERIAAEHPKCTKLLTQDRLFKMGPRLIGRSNPVLIMKWSREISKLENICQKLSRSKLETSKVKLKGFQQEIVEMKEVLACLPKDRL